MNFVTLIFQHFRPRMAILPIRTDEELAALRMPVQVILGGQDPMIRSTEMRKRVEQLVGNLQLTFLEGAGHVLPPQTSAIADFLRRNSPENAIAGRA